MKLSRKSKRVSWLPGVNLCQVRLFLSEEPPSKVGLQAENHPKMRSCSVQDSNSMECNDLPPGFGGNSYFKPLKDGLSFIPRIEWKCPPKFVLSNNLHVASGEESLEAETQQLREIRVLEAVYPRPSAIPPSSAVSLEIEDYYDDSHTPVIPLIPIEQGEVDDTLSELPSRLNHSLIGSHQPAFPQISPLDGSLNSSKCIPSNPVPSAVDLLSNLGVDLAIMKSKEGNLIKTDMIDPDLLLIMLSNPQMVGGFETLINKGYQAATAAPTPTPTSKPVTKLIPESGLKLAEVLEPLLENGKLHYLPLDNQPVSNSMTRFSPPSCPNHVRHLAPMSADTRMSVHPVTGSRLQAEPSLSTSMAEPVKLSVPSFRAVKPNMEPDSVPHTSGMMVAAQSNALLNTRVPATQTNSVVKDMNYFKNLIKEHGMDKKETHDRSRLQNGSSNYKHVQEVKLREGNSKFQKPCMYFNRPNGCRNGFNCPFVHGASLNLRTGEEFEMPAAKRMKLICTRSALTF